MTGKFVLAAGLLGSLVAVNARAADWPTWRGPNADGVCSEKDLPTAWGVKENVKWKTELPAPGNSTPIILGDQVFITQAKDKGKLRGIVCLDRKTGKIVWEQYLPFDGDEPTHEGNPFASGSVATDGDNLFAWFGSAGAAAMSRDGKLLWKVDLGAFTHIWGNASTPAIYQDLVILNCAPGERAFVVALNKKDGKEVWRVDGVTSPKDKFQGSWSSPKLVREGDRDTVLIAQPNVLIAYDPANGKERWRCTGLTHLQYTTPLVGEGIAVAMSGYHGRALAVKLGGNGDVTETHRLWVTKEDEKEDQRIGSGVILDGHIYMVNEPGFAQCINLKTGEKLWRERLGGGTWSSLLLADGKFYNVDKGGRTSIFAAQPKFAKLSEDNRLGEPTNASIAVSQGNLYIRTYQHLWCIGK